MMPHPTIHVDLANADKLGRLRLSTAGALADIARQGLRLKEGMEIICSDGEDFTVNGIVTYNEEEHRWVAVINLDELHPT